MIALEVEVKAWAAWSPGIESEADWRRWSTDPVPLGRDGSPDVGFLPALMRRRCDQLSRMMLNVAYRCSGGHDVAAMKSVFASQRGSANVMIAMLEQLVEDKPLSPNKFSHSVHNTQAGLFSIWAENSLSNTALAGGSQTFAHAFLEASAILLAEGGAGKSVLLVTADEAIPERLIRRPGDIDGAYAVGLVLGRARCSGLRLCIEAGNDSAPADSPEALRFLRWLLCGGSELRLSYPHRTWVWKRASPTLPAKAPLPNVDSTIPNR